MTVPVTNLTRAPKQGRVIIAPCGHEVRVYHFAWAAIGCEGCDGDHDKPEYRTRNGD
jgi:hypothetical protein